MKIVLFYHSLVSDWNHGNAHFLRGVATELIERGHELAIYEPADSWSRQNLVDEHGEAPIAEFHERYPKLRSTRYALDALDLDEALAGADLVIVHEWNEHDLVRRVGRHRADKGGYQLFFHDTHHRAITAPSQMQGYDLSGYDGVLAYGEVLRELYMQRDWTRRAWTWHEAADTRVFHPIENEEREGDVVWIGNWGDDERSAELDEFLVEPIAVLGLKAKIFGVRYPDSARERLRRSGIEYGGWLANYRAPEVFARYKMTVHVPRRPYVEALRGIPTIRPFEALACGIPLISSPWEDAENLFTPGKDFLVARNGAEMKKHMRALLEDKQMARELSEHGLRTIRERHTCAHRVDELLGIYEEVNA
ncbi:MAG: Spore_germination_protein_CgeB [uncultured Chthoniobacterales bacterium]|uniref:Spore_germination_protein_CgeB n=1 Tax=uncultured Chthoniobacterales bacterium TaxID=1836801 RepID=A0A6J4HFN6_9BACT|nr:MAG: Spore_germination_protein_CgeB [uncultured Chthoniobacterales bacterium]